MFFNLLGNWIRALISIALLVAGILLVKEWFDELPTEARARNADGVEVTRHLASLGERLEAWDPAPNRSTGLLVVGGLLLLLTFAGRFVSPWLWRRSGRSSRPGITPRVRRLKTHNGYDLHVEIHGSDHAPPLVLVHGVGSDRTQWREVVDDLSGRYCVYTFDLLGHGKSDHMAEAEHTLESAARDLDDVIALAGGERVVLAGHSMGGMIVLTWCFTHPAKRSRAAALVLVHTTPQNPFATMAPVPLHRRLQKPLHEPILRLTPALAPLVRLLNGLGYLNGTTHWANDREMFGGSESRAQLERSARLHARMDPAAVARFTLSMTRFEARDKLPALDLPTLVVAADKDEITVLAASRDIAARIPEAELVVLESTRHMGFMERRHPFTEAITRFLQQPGRASRARGPGAPRKREPRSPRKQPLDAGHGPRGQERLQPRPRQGRP